MALRRSLRVSLASLAALLVVAAPVDAAGPKLTIAAAKERAAKYARNTCKRDSRCIGSGVRGCQRHRRRVVVCRIFDRRRTDAQGRYTCTRLVRLALDPRTRRIPVTGVSDWSC